MLANFVTYFVTVVCGLGGRGREKPMTTCCMVVC